MQHPNFIRLCRFIAAILIPVTISTSGLHEIISISYYGTNMYWLPMWCGVGLAFGGLAAIGEMFSDSRFISVAASTILFGVGWVYWFWFILTSLIKGFKRRWAFILLGIFWASFSMAVPEAGPRLLLLGGCFVFATTLEAIGQPDVSSHPQETHTPKFSLPRGVVILWMAGAMLLGSTISLAISQLFQPCSAISRGLNVSGCVAEYQDLAANTGNSWVYKANLNFTPDGKYLLTGEPIFRVDTGQQIEWEPFGRMFSTDGVSVAEIGFGVLRVRSIESGQTIFTSVGSADFKRAVFSPNGALLAAVREQSTELFLTSSWESIATFGFSAQALDFSADSQLLATVVLDSWDDPYTPRMIQLWQVSNQRQINAIRLLGDTIEFSPNGSVLAVAGSEISLLRVPDFEIIQTFPAEVKAWDVAFSPDGTLLASAEYDKVRIRNLADGTTVCEFPAPGFSRSVAFSPDGMVLAWAGAESVFVWDWRQCPSKP